MSEKTQRPHAQTAEDKQAKHYAADWWIYLVLALFIGGLVFLTYAVILRGDAMSNVGKPGSPTAPPASAAPAPPSAEKK